MLKSERKSALVHMADVNCVLSDARVMSSRIDPAFASVLCDSSGVMRGLRLRACAGAARCQAVLRCTAALAGAELLGIGLTEFLVRVGGWG